MQLEMVLNELSLQNTANDERTARELMSNLVKTINLAVKKGIITLRTENRIYDIIIAPNYPISKWLYYDNQVDEVEKDFLLTLETQTPLLKEIKDTVIRDKVDLSDFKYQGETARELGISYLLDNLAISFNSDPKWNSSYLDLEFTSLDDSGKLIDTQIKVNHASLEVHIDEHQDWIKQRTQLVIKDGKELWNRKEELFPNLEFCKSVEKQLENIRTRQLELQPVIKALFELQNCSQNWNNGAFSTEGYLIETSGESEPTLNQYSRQRTFRCPDGKERLFEQHIKLRACNWRIHFLPENPNKAIIVGYIGRHLPTDKYK
jgi:hypothetical protein